MTDITIQNSIPLPDVCVIGIGGAGSNAVSRMADNSFSHIHYAVLNTDLQALEACPIPVKLQLGPKLTGGFGAGADPAVGQAAALESSEEIQKLTAGTNMVILTCGLGGGTGTGAAPVVAQICKDAGILTLAVVTTPFSFEGLPHAQAAEAGLEELKKHVDTLLVIPNDKLLTLPEAIRGRSFCLEEAFSLADTVLGHTIESIANIIFHNGLINLDFNDLSTVLRDKGLGHIGIGYAAPDTPVMEAMKQAIHSPLLDTDITGATNILINSAGRIDLTELSEAIAHVRDLAEENVNIIWGTVTDQETVKDQKIITLIATGIKDSAESPCFTNMGSSDRHRQNNITQDHADIYDPSPQLTLHTPDIPPIKSRIPQDDFIIPDFLSRHSTRN